MKAMTIPGGKAMNCERPDRDAPGITCGHPLPCPFHTVVIDTTGEVPTVTIPVPSTPPIRSKTLKALKEISTAIHEELDADDRAC